MYVKKGYILIESLFLFSIACMICMLLASVIYSVYTFYGHNIKSENMENVLREIYS